VEAAALLPEALAQVPVTGVFVTLWDEGRLRGCMGNFAPALALGVALGRAAASVVRDDPRFPAVTAQEVDALTVELSVLHSREVLGRTAGERLAALVIGEHGLDIEYRDRRGLLLPRVPVELGWDPARFLEEVCRKAGLPHETWRDPEADVFRFSAYCVGG
jgi:AmmeMemoRadiSam system protein A